MGFFFGVKGTGLYLGVNLGDSKSKTGDFLGVNTGDSNANPGAFLTDVSNGELFRNVIDCELQFSRSSLMSL